ncbi:hypothetical protein OPQ81_010978 [Rhizoctonia solani]|nr:hypothetical protein OPQ81_010978 [Rhizoctonia solani]
MYITPGKYYIKNAMAWSTFDEATDGTHIIHGWQQTIKNNQHWLIPRPQADSSVSITLCETKRVVGFEDGKGVNGTTYGVPQQR